MKGVKLKPCGHCGRSGAEMLQDYAGGDFIQPHFYVACAKQDECGRRLCIKTGLCKTRAKAAQIWNGNKV